MNTPASSGTMVPSSSGTTSSSTTSAQIEPTEPPAKPILKPILDWHAELETKRDLLCLAASLSGWDPLQEENSVDETIIGKTQYLGAIKDAETLLASCREPNQKNRITRASQVKLLAHPTILMAIIIRKPSAAETDVLTTKQIDPTFGWEETQAHFYDDLLQRTIWPQEGSPARASMMEDFPAAMKYAFSRMTLESVGSDRVASKKKG